MTQTKSMTQPRMTSTVIHPVIRAFVVLLATSLMLGCGGSDTINHEAPASAAPTAGDAPREHEAAEPVPAEQVSAEPTTTVDDQPNTVSQPPSDSGLTITDEPAGTLDDPAEEPDTDDEDEEEPVA